jgi:division protein CdvB (Snf7/Vps24/ESCRT-III family)
MLILMGRSRYRQSIRKRVAKTCYFLRSLCNKIEARELILQERNFEIFDKSTEDPGNESEIAKPTSEKYAEIRMTAKTFLKFALAIELVTFKLETAETFSDIAYWMTLVYSLISRTAPQIQQLIPRLAIEIYRSLHEIDACLICMCGDPVNALLPVAENILDLTDVMSDQIIKLRFPE